MEGGAVEPISIAFLLASAGSAVFRYFARDKYDKAAQAQGDALRQYRYSMQKAHEEHVNCMAACNSLAVGRQAAVGSHWARLDTLKSYCSGSPESFLGSREIFGQRSQVDAALLFSKSQSLVVLNKTILGDPAAVATGAALMIQGVDCLDKLGWISAPIMHTPLHDVVASLPFEHAVGVSDTLGALGGLEFADVLGGALTVVSIGLSFGKLSKAEELQASAWTALGEARKLDAKREELAGIRRQTQSLFDELAGASYELFKWTIVAEETTKIRRSTGGRVSFRLPDWIIRGLRLRAQGLSMTLCKPAFSQ
jgi:hypothetical protein